MSVDVSGTLWDENSLKSRDLQRFMDRHGTARNGAVERVMGIEPTLVAWEATVLPLNYTRLVTRFYSPDRPVGNLHHIERPDLKVIP